MASPMFFKDAGPAAVYWKGIFVGVTQGGFKVKAEDKYIEIKEDGQGNAVVDAIFAGRDVNEIELPLTRCTLAQLNTVIPNSGINGSILEIWNPVGYAMYALAGELEFRPMVNNVASTTTTEFVSFPKAYPVLAMEFGYDVSNQRTIKIKFKVFVKQESPNFGDLIIFGA